jgi:hypothetical protein
VNSCRLLPMGGLELDHRNCNDTKAGGTYDRYNQLAVELAWNNRRPA